MTATESEAPTIGELLRRRRQKLELKQAEVAERLGVNQSTVAKYERGDRIGNERLAAVADFLEMDFDEVMRIYHGLGTAQDQDSEPETLALLATQVQLLTEQVAALHETIRSNSESASPPGRSKSRRAN